MSKFSITDEDLGSEYSLFPEGVHIVELEDCEYDPIKLDKDNNPVPPFINLTFKHDEHGLVWQRIVFKDKPPTGKVDMWKILTDKLGLKEKVNADITAQGPEDYKALGQLVYNHVYDFVKTKPKFEIEVEHNEFKGKTYANINPFSIKHVVAEFDKNEELPF